ncbi:neuralized-like protein 4, partial [Chamaea fasciata]|uniref:neuralized-like protein 4 n=1 Tax=Chamaea fasciata TaxID=190680 RepID=UPI00336A497A
GTNWERLEQTGTNWDELGSLRFPRGLFAAPSSPPKLPPAPLPPPPIPDSRFSPRSQGPPTFLGCHGKNILLSNGARTATRVSSYNQGLVLVGQPLPPGRLFQVQIDALNPQWSSSLALGVTGAPPGRSPLPACAHGLKRPAWILQRRAVFHNARKIRDLPGPSLELLPAGTVLGLLVDGGGRLHLFINGRDQGAVAGGVPSPCYVLLDLYGQCQQVTIVAEGPEGGGGGPGGDPRSRGDVEKADVVDGVKESLCWGPPAPPQPCPYQALCARFKDLLLLPDEYFAPEPRRSRCFCEGCERGGGRPPGPPGAPPAPGLVPLQPPAQAPARGRRGLAEVAPGLPRDQRRRRAPQPRPRRARARPLVAAERPLPARPLWPRPPALRPRPSRLGATPPRPRPPGAVPGFGLCRHGELRQQGHVPGAGLASAPRGSGGFRGLGASRLVQGGAPLAEPAPEPGAPPGAGPRPARVGDQGARGHRAGRAAGQGGLSRNRPLLGNRAAQKWGESSKKYGGIHPKNMGGVVPEIWGSRPRNMGESSQKYGGIHPKNMGGFVPKIWGSRPKNGGSRPKNGGSRPKNMGGVVPKIWGSRPKNMGGVVPEIWGDSSQKYGGIRPKNMGESSQKYGRSRPKNMGESSQKYGGVVPKIWGSRPKNMGESSQKYGGIPSKNGGICPRKWGGFVPKMGEFLPNNGGDSS